MQVKGKRMSITLAHKKSGKEINFESLTEASQFLNISKMKLSRILRGKGTNETDYFVTENI